MNHNHLARKDRGRLLDRLDELADLDRLMRQPGLLSDGSETVPTEQVPPGEDAA